MRSLILLSILVFATLCFIACSGSTGPRFEDPAIPGAAPEFDIPAPAGLQPLITEPRSASYTEADLVKLGKDYDVLLPADNIMPLGNSLQFQASWNPGQGTTGLGYCMYAFNIPGYDRAPEVYATWSIAPQTTGSVFYGLANWDADRWDWFAATTDPVALPSFTPYISSTDDLLLTVAVIENGPVLDQLRLGPPPSISDWFHTWGGSDDEEFLSVATEANYGVFCAGHSYSYGAGGDEALLIAYDLEGAIQWARAWGDTLDDRYSAVVVADDGQVFAAGYTDNFGEGGADVLLQGWSENGMQTWTRALGTAEEDHAVAMALSGAILYVLCETSQPGSGTDMVLVKFDTMARSPLWQKYFGLEFDDSGGSLVVTHPTEGADVIHVTFNLGVDGGDSDVAYCTFDGTGALLTKQQWDNSAFETEAHGLVISGSGQVFIAGQAETPEMGQDLLLLEYSTEPTYVAQGWRVDPASIMVGHGVDLDGDGDLLIVGRDFHTGVNPGGLLARFDPAGSLLGANTYASATSGGHLRDVAYLAGYGALVAGNFPLSDDGEWTVASLSSRNLSGTWGEVSLDTGDFSGVTAFVTEGTVTNITTGIEDSGGGFDDCAVGLVTEP